MMLKTLTAALTAATLAFGMAACNRDNAGAGSSADQQSKRSGSAAGGSSSGSAGSASGSAGSSGGAMGSGGSAAGGSAGSGAGSTGGAGSK